MERFPENPIIRVMPNTPAQIGCGASALAPNSICKSKDLERAQEIFSALGLATIVEEEDLDLVTALSGSGPAYVFYLVEAMAEAASKLGLERSKAEALALQTVFGAGTLAAQSERSPSELRAQVTSPNGTTAAAIESLEKNGFKETLFRAVSAAKQRSQELS